MSCHVRLQGVAGLIDPATFGVLVHPSSGMLSCNLQFGVMQCSGLVLVLVC